MRHTLLAPLVVAVAATLAGCGGSSSPNVPTIAPARTFQLVSFQPAAPVAAGKPTTVSFVIRQPNGKPLKSFKRGPGPHTGVHLIYVRRDLGAIVHHHPPVGADGTIRDSVTFPAPGPYKLVIDVYPNTTGPQRNFQLFGSVRVSGTYKPQPLPPPGGVVDADADGQSYTFTMKGKPTLRAIQAGFLTVDVTAADGKPARFQPYYGALAHAIFFRRGSLDYFHTHVCAAGAAGCTSTLGATRVTGSATAPGKLRVGVLVPVSGTWRLFLQARVNGHVLTAPFTLAVRP
jgi:hypothetical protein